MGRAGTSHTDELQSNMGITPYMLSLVRHTRMPFQAIIRALLEPEEEEHTMSEYVGVPHDRLRAAYQHKRVGLQPDAVHQRHKFNGKVRGQEYQAGDLMWIHDVMLRHGIQQNIQPNATAPTRLSDAIT